MSATKTTKTRSHRLHPCWSTPHFNNVEKTQGISEKVLLSWDQTEFLTKFNEFSGDVKDWTQVEA